jgi:hypothetical protein
LAGFSRLLALSLRENLLQPLSFDCQPGPGVLGHLLGVFQQVLSHDYKDTPIGMVLKPFGTGKINNLRKQIDPDDILAHTSLSILYQKKGMVPEAEAEGNKARVLGWKQQLKKGSG